MSLNRRFSGIGIFSGSRFEWQSAFFTILCVFFSLVPTPSVQADTELKLPWRSGATWYLTTGKHEVQDFDFAPGGGGSRNDEVVAVDSGVAKIRCGPDSIGQAAVSLQTSAGNFEYWHLQGSSVLAAGITKGGISVSQGQVLGRLFPFAGDFEGTCGSGHNSHLHLHMPYLPITIQGTVFSNNGPAVLTRLTSNNDGIVAPPTPGLVTPGSAGFTRGGADSGWSSVPNGGASGRAIYTYVNNIGRDNYARWTFDLSNIGGTGNYKIETHIPTTNAGTTNARYQINTTSGVQIPTINQRQVNGWQTLGTFNLAAGSAWVELDDYTGEPTVIDQNHQIAFDSMRVTFVAPPSYTISATAGVNGTVSPAGDSKVVSGASMTYTISPLLGYHIASLSVDAASVAVAKTYTFGSVVGNHSISATFAPDLVTTKLGISSPSTASRNSKVVVTGFASNVVNGGTVSVRWKMKVGGKFIEVYTATASVKSGKFTSSKVLPNAGTWQVTAQFLGSGVAPKYLASNIATDLITIR